VNSKYALGWLSGAFAWFLMAAPAPPVDPLLHTLVHAKDVRTLSPEDARRQLPVKLRGVVTYVDTGSGSGQLFVQDATAGIFVFMKYGTVSGHLEAGELIDIEGVTTAGDFSPCVAHAHITVLGRGVVPEPKHPAFDQFLATREDGQWTELRGVVRSGEIKGGRLFLNVAAAGGSFLVVTPRYRDDWKRALVDSMVAVRGALAPIRNESRQAVGVRMFVPDTGEIRIEQAAPEDAFDRPISGASSVGGFRPAAGPEHRIRVRSTVTAVEPGAVYVSDGEIGLAIQALASCNLNPGEVADIVGFPGAVMGRPGLQDALCRKVSQGTMPRVVQASADAILPAQSFADPSGVGQAASTRFDMKLVRTNGMLLQVAPAADGYVLILEAGKRQFAATLPGSAKFAPGEAGSGDQVQVTGVCLITYDQYHRGQSFRILLRNAADVVVTASSPWWNLRRAMWGLVFMGTVILLSALWIRLLHQQVRANTRELRQANAALQRLSGEDPLTGVANRRQFDAVLRSEFGKACDSGTALSLLLVDIDHFKALNDSCGHLRGDECLARVARTLQSVLKRPADVVARYGGEEFAVILPGIDAIGARGIAESMRVAVLELAILNPGGEAEAFLSVSIGAATFCGSRTGVGEGLRPETVVALADDALYQAKVGGRNRCVWLEGAGGRVGVATKPNVRAAS
jgi:diguanylate cyclase (GGDEF)-like protein